MTAQSERAEIVAWLREHKVKPLSVECIAALLCASDLIERGDHIKEQSND